MSQDQLESLTVSLYDNKMSILQSGINDILLRKDNKKVIVAEFKLSKFENLEIMIIMSLLSGSPIHFDSIIEEDQKYYCRSSNSMPFKES